MVWCGLQNWSRSGAGILTNWSRVKMERLHNTRRDEHWTENGNLSDPIKTLWCYTGIYPLLTWAWGWRGGSAQRQTVSPAVAASPAAATARQQRPSCHRVWPQQLWNDQQQLWNDQQHLWNILQHQTQLWYYSPECWPPAAWCTRPDVSAFLSARYKKRRRIWVKGYFSHRNLLRVSSFHPDPFHFACFGTLTYNIFLEIFLTNSCKTTSP